MADVRPTHRPDVEGLRAVAVVLVVLNHLLAVPAGGFIGVDLFFVISGFVITAMLWRETSERRFTFRAFYWRRVRRLMPSALLVLLATNLAAQYFFLGPRVEQTRGDSLWALAFLANVHMADTDTDYFHANDAPSLLQHYWSLAVEEQFYFVWPVILVLLAVLARRRVGPALVLPITVALTGLSFWYAVSLVAKDPAQAYFSAPARAWELGAGAILGLVVSWGLVVPRWLQSSFAWMGVGLIVVACVLIDPTKAFPGAAALVPVGASLALILAGTGKGQPRVTRWLSHRVPRYIGRISYPVYLWHWPVIVISTEVWGRNTLVWVAAPFVSVVLAVLTHHLVEEPLRGRVAPRQAYRELIPMLRGTGFQKWAPLHNAGIGFLAYGLVLSSLALTSVPKVVPPATASRPVSSITTTPAARLLSAAESHLTKQIATSLRASEWTNEAPLSGEPKGLGAPEWVRDNCLAVTPATTARCTYGPTAATKTAALLGDSIAVSYLPGLRRVLEPLGWRIQLFTLPACNNAVPVFNAGKPYSACDFHRTWAISALGQLKPDAVILSNLGSLQAVRPEVVRTSALDAWREGLLRTLTAVREITSRVVVIAGPPTGANLQKCRTRRSSPADCISRVPRDWYSIAWAEAQAARATGAAYIDTEQWFCHNGACPAYVENVPVYWDGFHITERFSRRLTPVMASRITSLLRTP